MEALEGDGYNYKVDIKDIYCEVSRGWKWLGTLSDGRFWCWGSQIWDLGFYFRVLLGFMKNDLSHGVAAALGKI